MLQNSEASQPNIIIDLRIFRIDVTDYCEALPQDPLKHQGNSELDEKSIEWKSRSVLEQPAAVVEKSVNKLATWDMEPDTCDLCISDPELSGPDFTQYMKALSLVQETSQGTALSYLRIWQSDPRS